MADLRKTAVSPHTMQGGQPQAPRGLAATALDPLRRAYEAYQRSIGQPFQQAVRGGVRGYFGLPMMSDADALGREAYRQAEALGYTPGVGMPAGAVRLAAEGVQALPSIAGDIGRVIAGMPSGAGAAQAEDFARYQRSIPPSDVSPLTAFHGTPYRFEPTPANPLGEFRAAKIGSGEGAQAYGYGLYFAEAPGVAAGYRATLSSKRQDRLLEGGKKVNIDTLYGRALEHAAKLKNSGWNADEAKRSALQQVDDSIRFNEKYSPDTANMYRSVRQQLEAADLSKVELQEGSLYTVDIPDSMVEKMLDWDKPLSQQPINVREALANTKNKQLRAIFDYANSPYSTPGLEGEIKTMGEAIKLLGMNVTPAKGSAMLAKEGIPGIRYLDAGSRGGPDGTRNIVVFPGEESKVKILKRE